MAIAEVWKDADTAAQTLLPIAQMVLIPYLAWIGLRVIRLGRDQVATVGEIKTRCAEIDVRLAATDKTLDQRLLWLRSVETKIDGVSSKVDKVIGKLDAMCDL